MKTKKQLDFEENPQKPQFVPVVKWYEVHQDIEMRMIDHLETGNIPALIGAYKYAIARTKYLMLPYIKEDVLKFNIAEIESLRSQLQGEVTDYAQMKDNMTYTRMMELIQEDLELLHKLWFKAGINMPLIRDKNLAEAILEMD